MKKPLIIALLIFELLILFIITNTGSLFKVIQKKEIKRIKNESISVSNLLYQDSTKVNLLSINKRNTYFDRIYISHTPVSNQLKYLKDKVIFLYKQETPKGLLVFEKHSSLLIFLKKIKEISDFLTIAMIIFLLITAIIFLSQLKKKPDISKLFPQIDPLKNYLNTLKESENKLKTSLSIQEAKISTKEKLNKNIIEKINAAVIFINIFNRVEIFNNNAQKMFNYSYAKAINEDIKKVFSHYPEFLPFVTGVKTKTTKEIKSKTSFFLIDCIIIKNTGKLIIIKDITKEKIQKRVTNKAKNFSMLGEMSAYLSHEIRNSLGVIYGYTKTLKTPTNKIKNINLEINHLSDMISKFLNFSKPIAPIDKKRINLSGLFTSITNETKIKLKIISDDNLYLNTDPTLLKSAFSNLILNSKQANANLITLSIFKTDWSNTQIVLSDNGNGIGKINIDKIWHPFFTTKENGNGMGLPIVRKIITCLNGEIDLVKSDSNGTKFKILFYQL